MGMCPGCSKHLSEKDVREFFIKRFKRLPEQDQVYYDEWKDRLMGWGTGRAPEDYMDANSAKVWHEVTDTDDEIHFSDVVFDGSREWRVLELSADGVRLQELHPHKDDVGEDFWDEQFVSVKKLQTFEKRD